MGRESEPRTRAGRRGEPHREGAPGSCDPETGVSAPMPALYLAEAGSSRRVRSQPEICSTTHQALQSSIS